MSTIKIRLSHIEKKVSKSHADKIVAISFPYGSDSSLALQDHLIKHPEDVGAKYYVMCTDYADAD